MFLLLIRTFIERTQPTELDFRGYWHINSHYYYYYYYKKKYSYKWANTFFGKLEKHLSEIECMVYCNFMYFVKLRCKRKVLIILIIAQIHGVITRKSRKTHFGGTPHFDKLFLKSYWTVEGDCVCFSQILDQ